MAVPKAWKNGVSGGTPISAAALIDLEERLVDALGGTVGEGAPAKGLGKGSFYTQLSSGKAVALWEGQGAGKDAVQRMDLSGTPSKGSVGVEQVAASFWAALSKAWRSRHTTATIVGSGAQTAKKFWILNGQTSLVEAPAATSQPWRVGWVAADEVVEGLSTKCKIKAELTLAAAIKATVHVALYKVVKGEKMTLGEEVAGSGFDIAAGESANTGLTGESAEFAMPEDGDYALGATVSAEAKASCGLQARLLVHNTP
jgi:hypothetical protein